MTENYRNVLVAIDGSKESELAFQRALPITSRNGSHLYLVNVIDLRSYVGLEAYDKSLPDRAKGMITELLEKYKERAIAEGIENVEIVIEFGSPKELIPNNIADKLEIDLIISGATGLNSVEKFFIGSVSESILRRATCDVLIARDQQSRTR